MLKLARLGIERLAELDHIAPLRHGDPDAEHVLLIEAHVLARRVGVAVRNPRDVPEPHVVAVHAQQRVGDLILVVELPARTHEHPIVGGGEDPRS